MNINILTIFPEIFSFFDHGLVGQSISTGNVNLNCLDIRKNGKVDEGTLNKLEQMKPYYQVMGGASGSVTVK